MTTEADRKALYEANKSRFAGTSEAEAMKQIEPAVRQQKRRERQIAYVRELRKQAGVEVRLEPLRADLRVPEGAPRRGPEKAPVTIVEFSDFQCPFCVRAQPTLRRVRETYADKVRFVFLDFPLDMHPQAKKAHEAAACAGDQGKFWPMYDRLFASQGKFEVPDLKGYAAELGLAAPDFAACLDSGRHAAATERGIEEGARHGVTGTPAFFINGRMAGGSAALRGLRGRDRGRAGAAAASGVGPLTGGRLRPALGAPRGHERGPEARCGPESGLQENGVKFVRRSK